MAKLDGNDLKKIGYEEGRIIGAALKAAGTHFKGTPKSQALDALRRVLETPDLYKDSKALGEVAAILIKERDEQREIELTEAKPLNSYGVENVEQDAVDQMMTAMKLPITVAGALMPDAHLGYGLPIGGVLATKNEISPAMVGVDIGCRMCLSLFPTTPDTLRRTDYLTKGLMKSSRFGVMTFDDPKPHDVLDNPTFRDIKWLRNMKDKAYKQIGTSGGGNHFVEFGLMTLYDETKDVPAGQYLALLTHSGSRGFGASVAAHYMKIAEAKCNLPKEAGNLAWLSLDTEEGQEYWLAMNLAGDYASACHHQIHERIAAFLGDDPLAMVENHHNFAWKENGLIVHRKGATPAGKGTLGIIPGSMTKPGFLVEGLGNDDSLQSASHGAGRVMSRRKAHKSLDKEKEYKRIRDAGVTVIGSSLDEVPTVYKDIEKVMSYQDNLIRIRGKFEPRIVRMADDNKDFEFGKSKRVN